MHSETQNSIDRWCNGSTADFGSACLGSNPSRSTKKKGVLIPGRFFYIYTFLFCILQICSSSRLAQTQPAKFEPIFFIEFVITPFLKSDCKIGLQFFALEQLFVMHLKREIIFRILCQASVA